MRVPPELYGRLSGPLALLGGDNAWGFDATWKPHVSIEPAALCERLISHALVLLDDLMARTAVERFGGVDASASAAIRLQESMQ